MITIYLIFLIFFTIYSYFLVDPNLTLVNHPLWTAFRNQIIYLGYYQRYISWLFYLLIITSLFFIHYYLKIRFKKYSAIKIALMIGITLFLSYPFLSHDFFNYMFDAKILTFYGKNPYFYKALDFPNDSWLRFMHWTHRTYPYGPTFLLVSLIPSFLSFGKFFLSFLFFKLLWFIFYFLAVYYLNKLNKKWAMILATHPLVIVEGLINAHNDLIAVSLAIIGIYYLINNKNSIARLLLLFSGGIKYITLPLIFIIKPKSNSKYKLKALPYIGGINFSQNNLVILVILAFLIYLSFFHEVYPWYFLSLFAFLPFYEKLIYHLNIFFAALLLSYYPYIRFGGWDSLEKLNQKHIIVLAGLMMNLIYLFWLKLKHGKIS